MHVCDIHCHIVFGVDDGPDTIDDSLAMARLAYKQGIREIACTSHSGCRVDSYKKNLIELQKSVKAEGLDIVLYPGCEIQKCSRSG